MTTSPIEDSQRTAARAAGLAYLISFATVVFVQFGIHDRLIVEGNPAETVRNIMAHERLFRISIAGDLIYCVAVIVQLTALYVILKPVNRGLALLGAFWRLVYTSMWILMTLNLFVALRLLSGADYLRVFEAERLLDHHSRRRANHDGATLPFRSLVLLLPPARTASFPWATT